MQTILLITPPFTQLNTPYPATAYLKGFLNTKGYESHQADLGIEVILRLFSKKGLIAIFDKADENKANLSENSIRILDLREDYIHTIEPVIRFLQHKNPTLAHAICSHAYLPEASRFDNLEELDWAFGAMGSHDKARHLATLYLEDLGDLISEAVDAHFGFSRYAERLGRTATHFDELNESLLAEESLLTQMLTQLLEEKINNWQPDMLCISIPFPGNLFGGLKCGQYVKKNHPTIKVVLGGGYANTELRTLADSRVFDYIDYVCLDDGEAPLQHLLEFLDGKRDKNGLKRTFANRGGVVSYVNGSEEKDIPQQETGTPDYADLPLDQYLSVIEIANPMHRLWSDGRWNKLTLAHGCYWGKCSFCDVTLDYIKRYEPVSAAMICDRIEEIIAQTGENGFHFVDEAAPPALMRDVAIEIIRRRLSVVWWTNIRFENRFTADLCKLLHASGCIAVSGGLEVASDRLLDLMKKGVTVSQVAKVAQNFTQSGIMVHAYLMYGFPTQTAQETIDSLEMVRQLFLNNVLHSGFWHQFAMTAHSPVGLAPKEYHVEKVGPEFGGFADNDLYHKDPKGADHELFSEGLKKSIFNFMHGVCLDHPLQNWFDFKVPKTTVRPDYIKRALAGVDEKLGKNGKIIWLNPLPLLQPKAKQKSDFRTFSFITKQYDWELECGEATAHWLVDILPKIHVAKGDGMAIGEFVSSFLSAGICSFEDFEASYVWGQLRENGLVVV